MRRFAIVQSNAAKVGRKLAKEHEQAIFEYMVTSMDVDTIKALAEERGTFVVDVKQIAQDVMTTLTERLDEEE